MKFNLITTNDLIRNGHYLYRLFLSSQRETITIGLIKGKQMIKCPNGTYIEIHPFEVKYLKEKHNIEKMKNKIWR